MYTLLVIFSIIASYCLLWLFVAGSMWMSAQMYIGMGHGQFVGPSAHDKKFIRDVFHAKDIFERWGLNVLCCLVFCVVGCILILSRL